MLLGLVGKPSAGKSTFFKAATLAEVEIASYPFTTIKPNNGVGYVRVDCIEKEFNTKCQPAHGFCIDGNRFVPVELMDVAGLVPGASEGKGLGNKFLDDLRKADIFIHVVDVSGKTDAEGKPTENYAPEKDVEFLEDELNKWYFNILSKAWRVFSKKVATESDSSNNFEQLVTNQFSGLKVSEEHVKEALRKIDLEKNPHHWSNEQLLKFASELRKISKPTIIAANKIDLENSEKNYEILKEKYPDYLVVPCSADSELALRQASKNDFIYYIPGGKTFTIEKGLNEGQKNALEKIRKNVLEKYGGTGVQKVLDTAVFKMLNHLAVFPASANRLKDSKGRVLPDCFLLPKGSTALDFAYFLHTDFGKGFIKAIDAKTKKALGKNYELKHRDAIEIVTR